MNIAQIDLSYAYRRGDTQYVDVLIDALGERPFIGQPVVCYDESLDVTRAGWIYSITIVYDFDLITIRLGE